MNIFAILLPLQRKPCNRPKINRVNSSETIFVSIFGYRMGKNLSEFNLATLVFLFQEVLPFLPFWAFLGHFSDFNFFLISIFFFVF